MRSMIAAAALAATFAVTLSANVTPASAAPPVATPSPGYDARLAKKHPGPASARRRYYRRHGYYGPQTYYGPDSARPYVGRPYYYEPDDGYGPVVLPLYGLGFGLGW
jgi:hypothetical protein